MKKFLFVLIGLIVAGNALGSVASCKVEPCSGRGNDCLASGTLTRDPGPKGEKWTYVCEKNHCETGDIVCSGDLEKCFACYVAGQAGVNFLWAGDDRWQNVKNCENDILKKDSHAHKVLWNGTNQKLVFGGDVGEKVISASNFMACIKHVCDENYVESNGVCVSEKQGGCKDSGGEWNDTVGSCICEVTVTNKTDYECECKSGYEWNDKNDHSKGCYDVAAATQNKTNKENCESTGGEWKSNKCSCDVNKNLMKNGNVCECKSSDYQYDAKQKKCTITDIAKQKEACAKISDATWGEASNKCVCRDPMQEPDMDRLVCAYPDGYEACKVKPDVADWIKGGCVCKQSGYTWNGIDCIKGAELEVEELYKDIDGMVSNYKTSKWKDKDGNFNTARLVSDSIAGVVLGTVGSVVTSTVIKKNQIEDGFEDLKCAIGGQTVATWGDEFVVGVQ